MNFIRKQISSDRTRFKVDNETDLDLTYITTNVLGKLNLHVKYLNTLFFVSIAHPIYSHFFSNVNPCKGFRVFMEKWYFLK